MQWATNIIQHSYKRVWDTNIWMWKYIMSNYSSLISVAVTMSLLPIFSDWKPVPFPCLSSWHDKWHPTGNNQHKMRTLTFWVLNCFEWKIIHLNFLLFFDNEMSQIFEIIPCERPQTTYSTSSIPWPLITIYICACVCINIFLIATYKSLNKAKSSIISHRLFVIPYYMITIRSFWIYISSAKKIRHHLNKFITITWVIYWYILFWYIIVTITWKIYWYNHENFCNQW